MSDFFHFHMQLGRACGLAAEVDLGAGRVTVDTPFSLDPLARQLVSERLSVGFDALECYLRTVANGVYFPAPSP